MICGLCLIRFNKLVLRFQQEFVDQLKVDKCHRVSKCSGFNRGLIYLFINYTIIKIFIYYIIFIKFWFLHLIVIHLFFLLESAFVSSCVKYFNNIGNNNTTDDHLFCSNVDPFFRSSDSYAGISLVLINIQPIHNKIDALFIVLEKLQVPKIVVITDHCVGIL